MINFVVDLENPFWLISNILKLKCQHSEKTFDDLHIILLVKSSASCAGKGPFGSRSVGRAVEATHQYAKICFFIPSDSHAIIA
jgi:hypothetical protein